MAPFCLVNAFQGMRVSSPVKVASAVKSLSSTRNGICAVQKVACKPLQAASLQQQPPLVVEAKLKTHKAAAKRFRVTGSGKVRARRCGKQHMNEKKSKDRKRHLSESFVVNDSDLRNVRGQLPYSRIRKTQNTITAKKSSK